MTHSRSLLVALVVLLVTAPASWAQFPWFGRGDKQQAEIAWIDAPADALAAAAQTGKPILAYVTTENCGFCRKMEKETWGEPEIGRLVTEGFIPLRLHTDRNPDEVAALRVRAFPTTVLISPQGKAFAGRPGFMQPDELTELLRPVLRQRALAGQTASLD